MQSGRLLHTACALLPAVSGCFLFPSQVPSAPTAVGLELVADEINAPVGLAFPDDGSGRMFVVSQAGRIHIVDASGGRRAAPFLDLSSRIVELNPGYDERGLLGLAFHPDYAGNGRFYVYYVAPPGPEIPDGWDSEVRVSEFRVSGSDANAADPDSERRLLTIGEPQATHNAGQLAFGPDGMLYIATGDGGGAADRDEGHTPGSGNAQDKSKLLGKILRIDVDGEPPYRIPADNPFVSDPAARPEIYAYGLRNPWRFSIDVAPDGRTRIFAGDVGQFLAEEVDLIESGGNYGWRIREGSDCFDQNNLLVRPADCASSGADGEALIPPIIEYSHREGSAVIGGVFYRGEAVPALSGQYVFGDFSASPGGAEGRVFAARETDGAWAFEEVSISGRDEGRIGRYIYAFGLSANGDLFVLTNDRPNPTGTGGEVYRFVSPP